MSKELVKVEQSEAVWNLMERLLDTVDDFPEEITLADAVLACASAARSILLQDCTEQEVDIQLGRWEHLQRQNAGILDGIVFNDYLDILGYVATWLGSEALSAIRAAREGCACLECKGARI